MREKVDGGLEESGDDGWGNGSGSGERARRGCTKVLRADGREGSWGGTYRTVPYRTRACLQCGAVQCPVPTTSISDGREWAWTWAWARAIGAAKQGSRPGEGGAQGRASTTRHSAAKPRTAQHSTPNLEQYKPSITQRATLNSTSVKGCSLPGCAKPPARYATETRPGRGVHDATRSFTGSNGQRSTVSALARKHVRPSARCRSRIYRQTYSTLH